MAITINELQEILQAGYPITVIINGEYYNMEVNENDDPALLDTTAN